MTFAVLVVFFAYIISAMIIGRIPKTGREGIKTGNEVIATITNNNKSADRPATLRAEGEGRRFKVKMKPDEAHLWIKGDKIKVIISPDNPKKYRILFNDYFHENEERIREEALRRLAKANENLPAARLIKYTKETYAATEKSSLSSQRIFTLYTILKGTDTNILVLAVFTVLSLWWKKVQNLALKDMILPILLILIMLWAIYSSVNAGTKIKKEVEKSK